MIEWQHVEGGRARTVTLKDNSTAWVLVNEEDGNAQFYAEAESPADLTTSPATGGLPDLMDQLNALDIIAGAIQITPIGFCAVMVSLINLWTSGWI